MKKTFKEFAEACWDTHKQVGTKISSRTGKRVPNCVPKNEDNIDEKKVTIQKGDKTLTVWDAELRTYQQMGWELVKEYATLQPGEESSYARQKGCATEEVSRCFKGRHTS